MFTKKKLNLDQFYSTFNTMLNLKKLIIDKRIIDSKFEREILIKQGTTIIINKNP
jgi:hypothetical protein